jgi:hypothetical protein
MHLATRASRTPICEEAYDGHYHIINTALNLVTGENLAWQERKAASFVFTPHFSGFEVSEEPGVTARADDVASDGYRPTDRYGYPPTGEPGFEKIGGIPGPARHRGGDPNMGYHSSAAAAFLMTMFNVRLGWLMGNPRHRVTHAFSSPRILGLAYLLNELTGNSDDRSRYVNLSDGGHFDNLGVYELVRRRCRWIVVCDAGRIPGRVRRTGTLSGWAISVDIDLRLVNRASGRRQPHGALRRGHIRYQSGRPEPGLPRSLTGDEPPRPELGGDSRVTKHRTSGSTSPSSRATGSWVITLRRG